MNRICLYVNDDGTMAITEEPTDMLPENAAPVNSVEEACEAIKQMVGAVAPANGPMMEEDAAMMESFKGRGM